MIKKHQGYVHVRFGKVAGSKVYRSETNSLKAYQAALSECPAGCVVSSFAYMQNRSPESCKDLEVIDVTARKTKTKTNNQK